MRNRSTTIIAGGALVALLGAITVVAYGRAIESKASPGATATAFVASKDIPPGTKSSDAAMIEKKVPASIKPATAIKSQEELSGRTSVREIAAGEIVTAQAFGQTTNPPAAGGLEIPPGRNAVSMNVGVPQGVAQYIQSGDIINIFWTFKGTADPKAPVITELLLSNVQVLSNRIAQAPGTPAAISADVLLTLALTPPDAERLIFARENGSLWFGLVHAGDAPAATTGQNQTTILR